MELKTLIAENNEEGHEGNMGQRIYDLAVIANATNNFSSENKLGEGGFGPVYKVCFWHDIRIKYDIHSPYLWYYVLTIIYMLQKC